MHIRTILILALGFGAQGAFAVIGGQESTLFPEVVKLRSGERVCSGTIIGPRTIISAAHCATRENPYFEYMGRRYDVKYLSSTDRGHDIALAVTESNIAGAIIAKLGRGIKHGTKMLIAGFGCTAKGGKPGGLHVGATKVVGMDDDHILSTSKNGGVLCDGDSGGPAFIHDGREAILVAVNSLSDIRHLNINVRLDSVLSYDFLNRMAKVHRLTICGLNGGC
ncbi:MAG TPA: trypsin-like serine protease [Bdellovibrionales bacterium]|nr:trypsin-like serine protease [Bdellovibrionales bacterium]